MRKVLLILISFFISTKLFSERCSALTQKSTQCKREATQASYCTQHYRIKNEVSPFANTDFGNPSTADTIVIREAYTLGYSEAHEQPLWVMYKLTRKEVQTRLVKRDSAQFQPDPDIPTGSAQLEDYRRSGYDRGHMIPAADVRWSQEAMRDSFYLSNICPQEKSFNAGNWADLEQKMRYWATVYGEIYIVTGPILPKEPTRTIGLNKVTVPDGFYKVVYAPTSPSKGIGFILPHKQEDKTLQSYTVTIDAVEERTRLDFFSELPDEEEMRIEGSFSIDAWKW